MLQEDICSKMLNFLKMLPHTPTHSHTLPLTPTHSHTLPHTPTQKLACPWIWKSGLIKCFINRAFIVCKNWFTCHEEISKLKDIFHMNGYPREIFYHHVRTFLNENLMTTNSCQNMNDEKKYKVIIPLVMNLLFSKSH